MRKVEQLYSHLEGGPTPACDEILAAGLALAEPDYFDELVGVLIRRRNEAAWGGLIEHWHRLTFDVQEILQSDDTAMLGGIARGMRGNPDARYHALVALEQHPRTGAAYLLPAALRDPAARVREAAARCFRLVAELHQDRLADVQSGAADAKGHFAEEHEQMLAAVAEVLATFDVHLRVELVEASLWFAAELGDGLWERLNRPRTRLARVVAARLEEWNTPRLAPFLLLALRHHEWRTAAQKILREWDTNAYAGPLLRNTQLLSDPETASGVAVIRGAAWLAGEGAGLTNVPAALRPCVPAWIARLGIADAERVQLLGICARRGDTDTQAAAIAALAMLDRGGAPALLRELARGTGQLAIMATKAIEKKIDRSAALSVAAMTPSSFSAVQPNHAEAGRPARGVGAGGATAPPHGATETSTGHEHGAAGVPPREPAGGVDEFLELWQACRRAQGDEHAALVARLRGGAERWQTPLLRHANSADPRDRMQLLRVLDTPKLKSRFAAQAGPLLHDPVPAVRDLAAKILGPTVRSAVPVATEDAAPASAQADHESTGAAAPAASPQPGGRA